MIAEVKVVKAVRAVKAVVKAVVKVVVEVVVKVVVKVVVVKRLNLVKVVSVQYPLVDLIATMK